MKSIVIAALLSASLLGCGTATFDPSPVKADYGGRINKLSFVVQVDSLEEAFMLGTQGSSETEIQMRGVMAARYVAAVAAIKEGLVSNFRKAGVDATVSVARNGAELSEQIAQIRDLQVMHARVASYLTATKPSGYRYWDSGLTWELSFYDRNKSTNPTGGVVWRTKTGMFFFKFGCGEDFKECGNRFGSSIVDELKRVELISKR